jgi:hypothetical protein
MAIHVRSFLWLIMAIAALRSPLEAQGRKLLGLSGTNRVYLETDSTNLDDMPTMRFLTSFVSPTNALLFKRWNTLDCENLRGQTQIGRSRWYDVDLPSEPAFLGAHAQLCGVWEPSRWSYMFEGDNRKYLVDRATSDTIPRMRGVKRVWIKVQLDTSEASGGSKKLNYSLTRYDFDCGERRMRRLSDTDYDSTGKVLSTFEVPTDSAKWSAIIPESVGESMSTWVCKTLPRLDKAFQ